MSDDKKMDELSKQLAQLGDSLAELLALSERIDAKDRPSAQEEAGSAERRDLSPDGVRRREIFDEIKANMRQIAAVDDGGLRERIRSLFRQAASQSKKGKSS